MSVIARMRCHHIEDHRFSQDGSVSSRTVKLSPVYDSNPKSPNYSFSQSTPSGEVTMGITNPAAFNQFEVNKLYDVTFTEYQEPAKAAT